MSKRSRQSRWEHNQKGIKMAQPRRNNFKVRFNNVKYAFYKKNRRTIKVSPQQKEKQENYCFLVNEIERYGFSFFPDHYVRESIRELESFVK